MWRSRVLILILPTLIPNETVAKNWYGAKYKDSYLITTEDGRTNGSFSFRFSDGRYSFKYFTFNPISILSMVMPKQVVHKCYGIGLSRNAPTDNLYFTLYLKR